MSQTGEVKKDIGSLISRGDTGALTIGAQCHDHVMYLTKSPAKKFYSDFAFNYEMGEIVGRYYNLDSPAGGHDIYDLEVEALGGKLIYGENSMPTIDFREPLIKSPEDLKKLKMKKVDFHTAGRYPSLMKSGGLVQADMAMVSFCSPFSLAVGLMGFPALIKAMRKHPDFAHDVFKFIVDDVLTPSIKAQNETMDALMGVGADAWACVPNLSPKEMQEWVVPYNQRLEENVKKIGVTTMNVSGDYCEERIEKFDPKILHDSFDVEIASMGGTPAIFLGMGRWHEYPLEAVRNYTEKFRKKGIPVTVTAGINARLLRDGPIDKIVDTVKRYIDAFARDHNLSIFLMNVPYDTPSAHIHAAVAATHTYGKLPIANNLDDINFVLPKRESFDEWVNTEEAKKKPPKEKERRGLAGLLWGQMGKINNNPKFKELYADAKMSFLYNLTDQRYGALIKVENGRLEVEHVRNDEETLKSLKVDALLACPAGLFFDFSAGKLSKVAMIGKMLTGKLKVKGAKKMKELGNIMALMS
ncbi:MAG: uroporphyrinogen decarboxylase family protein [Promethearchaeota archaeon]